MKEISLTQGKVALVDDNDFEELNKYKWCAAYTGNVFYAVRTVHNPLKSIRMHRVILSAPKGQDIDHKNGNRLDNRKENLRFCTPTENQHNQRSLRGGSSKYKGVSWFKSSRKWMSRLKLNKKEIYLGLFETEIEAAKTYNNAARKYFGEFACLNNIRGEHGN